MEGKFTLKDYAKLKRLPMEYLQSIGCADGDGTYITIPYYDEHHNPTLPRRRYAHGHSPRFRWTGGTGTLPLSLYGLWNLPAIRKAGFVILVNGESDAQTLDFLGFPVLGIPGSVYLTERDVHYLLDIPKIFIFARDSRKPDEYFCTDIVQKLSKAEYTGTYIRFNFHDYPDYDVSDLFVCKYYDAKPVIFFEMRRNDFPACFTGLSASGHCGNRVCAENHGVRCCGDCPMREDCNSACGWIEGEMNDERKAVSEAPTADDGDRR